MRGRQAGRGKEAQPPAPTILIAHSLRTYSHENLAWLQKIDAIVRRPKGVLGEIKVGEVGEWLERYFKAKESDRELAELVQYYKYYQCTPLLAGNTHFHFMNNYWTRSKTVYYKRVKKILQIDHDTPQESLECNISNQEYSRTEYNSGTFYVMPHLYPHPSSTNDNTLQQIISSLQRQSSQLRGRTIKDIDKAYKFLQQQSKTKQRHSQQKSHLKSNPSHLVSQFTYTKPKRKKQNHKSLSNEPHTQECQSRGKKLATASSCMNINSHDNNLNYLRRDKNLKNSQKEIKQNKRETSQSNLQECRPRHNDSKSKASQEIKGIRRNDKISNCNNPKGNHKKTASNERSSSGGVNSKSNKKRQQTHTKTNVKAAIDKTKNKIKMEKSMMLKKYGESRQSYTKSIDSTCGEVGRHTRK